ncbi:histidine kinase [Streptomyces niveiscabiei]|uniref:sensor histidine kinase n=1 Tax=Streptomyces niveiscabiei TaxID=164115 RepID=UPI0029BF190C|nr:histidine kinase [Streptomyces niveiscabiei]MDX3386678.1 histidine kinase [Streptomyces niveiscabiei]
MAVRPHRDDLRIAAAGLAGGVLLWALGLFARPGGDNGIVLWDGEWPPLVPLAAMAACELLRRTHPNTAALIGTATLALDTVTRGSVVTVLMYTDLIYAAVLYGTPATARLIPRVSALLTLLGTTVPFAFWHQPDALLIGFAVGLVTLTPAMTGVLVRDHRSAAEAAGLRAEQTALLAELDRTQAVTAERARMARELHDLVAGHLSAIAIHSTAALSIGDPDTSKKALAVIRENSVEGLAEMRRLIGILRDPDDRVEPAPTLEALPTLIDGARANGLDVTLTTPPPTGAPAPVALAAYRIVQESLTNALKHASPGEVTVSLHSDATHLKVTVTSPYAAPESPRAPGSGAGLIGMRERATLIGGTFDAGPRNGRWTVSASLPLPEGDPA